MDIGSLYIVVQQKLCQLLCHTFGKGGDEYTFIPVGSGQNLIEQIIYLVFAWADFNLRIEQSRRADQLFYYHTFRFSQLIVGWGGTHVDGLMNHTVKFLEGERTVVEGGRQSETVFHQVLLSGSIATIHRTDLRNAHMALIYHQKEVFREEIEQAVWAFSFVSAIEISRIVLDARTVSQLLDHLHIVFHTLLDALCLDAIAYALEEFFLLHQVVLYHSDGDFLLLLAGYKKVGRINLIFFEGGESVIGEGIYLLDAVYLVIPPGYSQHIVAVRHEDIYRFSLYAEIAALQFDVVSYIEGIYQFPEKFISVELLSPVNLDDVFLHSYWSTHTIDA